MKLLMEVGRFLAVAAALAMVMPVYLMTLFAVDGVGFSFEFYMLGLAITFPLACIGGVAIGWPAWLIIEKIGWNKNFWKVLGSGGVAGSASVSLFSFIIWRDAGSVILGPIIGFPAGLFAGVLWYYLHVYELQQISDA